MQNRRIADSTTSDPRLGLRMQGYTPPAMLRRALCWRRTHLGDVRQSGSAGVSRGGTSGFNVERRTVKSTKEPYLPGWALEKRTR
jgi:hypothetical protein